MDQIDDHGLRFYIDPVGVGDLEEEPELPTQPLRRQPERRPAHESG